MTRPRHEGMDVRTARVERGLPAAARSRRESLGLGVKQASGRLTGSGPRLGVLVVDDDPLVARSLSRLLSAYFDVQVVDGPEAAWVSLQRHTFDVLVSDYDMPERDGASLLSEAAVRSPATARVLMSGGSVPRLAELIEDGVADAFVPKRDSASALVPLLWRLRRRNR